MDYDDYEPTYEEMMLLLEVMKARGGKMIDATTGKEVTPEKLRQELKG